MDFGSLLHVAQKNETTPKKEIKYYSTKFEPPKKEERSKQLSSNIKKFLARKEAEEKQKRLEATVKREELLALRSQDRKATRRVAVMLKRTKSANKSVIQDAVDNDNTAVTLAGPSQPDEDDYGYVSQEASAFYNKMMQKYNNMPEEDKKFAKSRKNVNTNLKEIKDRVRAAIQREQDEALLPHKRKRKPKETEPDDNYKEEEKQEEKPKPKPRPPAPPPMNFNDLLKIAEKKQFEPIKIEPKVKSKDDEPLMTKKQKREFEKEKAWREKKERGDIDGSRDAPKPSDKMGPPPNKIPKLNSSINNGKIPKQFNSDDRKSQNPLSRPIPKKGDDRSNLPRRPDDRSNLPRRPDDRSNLPRRPDDRSNLPRRPDDRIPKKSDDRNNFPKRSDDRTSLPKKSEIRSNNGVQNQSASSERRPIINKESKLRAELEKSRNLSRPPPKLNDSRPQSSSLKPTSTLDKNKSLMRKDSNGIKSKGSLSDRPKQNPPSNLKPKQFPPSDLKPKQFPPSDLKPKQFPPADLRPKQFPPPDVRRRPKDVKRKPPMGHKRRILDDDDSEYDSEMDDFIDDGPEGQEDYSKYISEIFGYDKSKYRPYDDEDDNMESSFSQMMREEFISGKIGLMEDLEDMKLEAEEKKKKAIMKKKMTRK